MIPWIDPCPRLDVLATLTGLRVYGALPHRGGRAEGRLRARA